MPLSILQLAASDVAASGDAIASLDIPEDGFITGIEWCVNAINGFASEDALVLQLSFLSTNQFNQNDARGVISNCQISAGTITTNGLMGVVGTFFSAFSEGLDVSGGERLHLHAQETGTATIDVHVLVHLSSRRRTVRRTRRRT